MHLRCYTCWWISNQFEQKWPQYKHERSQFMAKFDLTSGLFDLTSKQFYYVKIQSIPSQANFDLTRGMSSQAWSLQLGSGVSLLGTSEAWGTWKWLEKWVLLLKGVWTDTGQMSKFCLIFVLKFWDGNQPNKLKLLMDNMWTNVLILSNICPNWNIKLI